MSKPRSRLIDYKAKVYREVRGFTTAIHFGRQRKHFAESRGFIPGKSVVTLDIVTMQRLVSEFAGSGYWISRQKERVDFKTTIGYSNSENDGESVPTTRGTIHYSAVGCHVVPFALKTRGKDT